MPAFSGSPVLQNHRSCENLNIAKLYLVKKKGKAIRAIRTARLGAAHPAGSDTDRNTPVASCPAGRLCWWGLQWAYGSHRGCAVPWGEWELKAHLPALPRGPSLLPVAFPGISTILRGRELVFLLLPASGISGSPHSQGVCVADSGCGSAVQDLFCQVPCLGLQPPGPFLPLTNGSRSRCCHHRGLAGWRHPFAG